MAFAGGGGPDKAGYRWLDSDAPGGPAYQWTEIRAVGTSAGTGDDATWKVPMQQAFHYYGHTYDSLHICTNGFVSFTSASTQGLPPSAGFPDSSQPNACVGPYWNDLELVPGDGSGLYYYRDAVHQRFIVEWDSVRRFYGSLDSFRFSFQAVLDYSDSSISFYFRHANTYWQETYNGYTASKVGIENQDGSVGLDIDWNLLHDGYAVRFYHRADSNDVKAVAIVQPGKFLEPNSPVTCQLQVTNLGLAAATFPASCTVFRHDTLLFTDTVAVNGLAPGDSLTVSFASWTCGDPGEQYALVMRCALNGDQVGANDSLTAQLVAFSYHDKLISVWRSWPVTIDGRLDPGEWAASARIDISDILSINGLTPPAGSAYLYAANDSSCLYLAADIPCDPSLENGDALSLSVDDNGDGTWAGDSSEGQYLIMDGHGSDTLLFTAYPSAAVLPHPGLAHATGVTSGHVQYELAIPLGSGQPCWLNNIPGGTCRLHCKWKNGADNGTYGWWPQVMALSQDGLPAFFGTVALASINGIAAGQYQTAAPALTEIKAWNAPNPFPYRTAIRYQLPRAGQVTLGIYNIAGQCVATLVNEAQRPGLHAVCWSDADRYAAGIYFYRLTCGGQTRTGKMQLIK